MVIAHHAAGVAIRRLRQALAVASAISLAAVVLLGIWPDAMVTLALVLTSLLFCVVIGLPLGIWLASSDRAQRWMRPLLDAMQTTPAFVYLVPVVMLFGIGNVPGVIVTIVFALPPLVRLTNLGLRQVRPGPGRGQPRLWRPSPTQLLLKVQLPLAMPSIMAGINQTLMLSLSMVVIASMIAVGGLGRWCCAASAGWTWGWPPSAASGSCCWPSCSTASPRPWASRAVAASAGGTAGRWACCCASAPRNNKTIAIRA